MVTSRPIINKMPAVPEVVPLNSTFICCVTLVFHDLEWGQGGEEVEVRGGAGEVGGGGGAEGWEKTSAQQRCTAPSTKTECDYPIIWLD